jgi:hypothetical protein
MLKEEQTENLKTEVVESRAQIIDASRLTRYYSQDNYTAKQLDEIIHYDAWKAAELLTDLVPYAKTKSPIREAVGFILLTEINIKKKGNHPRTDLAVSIFAHKPFYDLEIVTSWVDYRLKKACEFLGRVETQIWSVHERNVPLQCALRDIGFRVGDQDREEELLIFMR